MSIKQSFPHFVVDTYYSQSTKHTASLIRRLCEITRDSSHVFTRQDWIRRNWLAGECSEVCTNRSSSSATCDESFDAAGQG